MTYISTDEALQRAERGGRLCYLEPLVDLTARARLVMVHPALLADLNKALEVPAIARARAALNGIADGSHVTMGFTPRRHKKALMGRLEPTSNGMCDVRSRQGKPGLRVFGRFARQDAFVALTWRPRSVEVPEFDLPALRGDELQWSLAVLEAEDRWKQALGDLPYLVGDSWRDYFSENASRHPD